MLALEPVEDLGARARLRGERAQRRCDPPRELLVFGREPRGRGDVERSSEEGVVPRRDDVDGAAHQQAARDLPR